MAHAGGFRFDCRAAPSRSRLCFANVSPVTAGFWGIPTSSVDWCEANYAESRYVCELYNTVSSVAMLLVGLLGVALHRRSLEARFSLAFGALAVVGLGSALFHATLRFELQMLDELPMLYLALVMVFILLELEPGRKFGSWLPLALVGHGIVVTALCAGTRGRLQFFAFHLSFGSLEAFCLYRTYALFRRTESPLVRKLFGWGMTSYLLAVALWFSDLRYCSFFSVTLPSLGLFNPQFHAVWHVLVSFGFYCLILLIAHERLVHLGQAPELALRGGWLPRLTYKRPSIGRPDP